jgi:hypothetical protein
MGGRTNGGTGGGIRELLSSTDGTEEVKVAERFTTDTEPTDFNAEVKLILAGAKEIRRRGFSYRVLGAETRTIVVPPLEDEPVEVKIVDEI